MVGFLGNDRHLLLSLHAVTGYDTTSRPFGIGKPAALKKLLKLQEMKEVAVTFLRNEDVTLDTIVSVGEKALSILYVGRANQTLDDLRNQSFCTKVAVGTSFVQTHTLPPTSSNAKFHSLRVYFQVQEWLGVPPADFTQYGWQHGSQGQLLPVISSTPAAPPELLKIIRCTCLGNCETNQCSCRKHGLEC